MLLVQPPVPITVFDSLVFRLRSKNEGSSSNVKYSVDHCAYSVIFAEQSYSRCVSDIGKSAKKVTAAVNSGHPKRWCNEKSNATDAHFCFFVVHHRVHHVL